MTKGVEKYISKNNKNKGKQVVPAVQLMLTSGNPNARKNKKNGNGVNKPRLAPRPSLSACAAKYALAITDPWNTQAAGACLPTWPCPPSQKVMLRYRGETTIGSNGVGMVCVSPCLSNNSVGVWTTDITWAGTTVTANDAAGGVSSATFVGSPYTAAQLADVDPSQTVRGRIVSVGASIEYTGPLLDRGGMIYAYSQPNHENVTTLTVAEIASLDNSKVESNRGQKVRIVGVPVQPTDVDFHQGTSNKALYPWYEGTSATSPNTAASPCMAFLVTGEIGNTYQVTVVIHAEYIGTLTAGRTTRSESDTLGFQAVTEVAQDHASNPGPNLTPSELIRRAEVLVGKLSGAVRVGAAVAKGYQSFRSGNMRGSNRMRLMDL